MGHSLLTQGAFWSELPLGELQVRPRHPRLFWDLALVEMPDERRSPAVSAIAALVRPTVRNLVCAGDWPGATLEI